ncbi:hairy and enhancer of split-related protein helt [Hemiscyllium ocellatum]|uniref:hairy and enhancer of split-related protein helt n=1 Tax=Hemiscyllium ocellatum TaxID=170820 RepID=UPI0029674DAD|nr:hairy and enhancer of split-related protein helt [Hemiscyllium ocellatum]
MSSKAKERKAAPVSHKVIEKRRRDRINRCLNELGKTIPMALAKQGTGKLEKAEILEMTVQYLRALHSADLARGREKGELLTEFANYFHAGYHECMKNLVHYLTTVERLETKDTTYARILAFLQSKARQCADPIFGPVSTHEPEYSYQFHPVSEFTNSRLNESLLQQGAGVARTQPLHWHSSARSPGLPFIPSSRAVPIANATGQQHNFLHSVQSLDRHYINLIGHSHTNTFSLHNSQHTNL